MFEDFRKQTEDASFPDDNQTEESPVKNLFSEQRHFLGLTPVQRFIVAFMLLLMTIILGVLFLLVTSKIFPPFLG
jgi:hypothetical protein